MPDCLFCRIAAGAEPAHVVFEDEVAMAFLDIRPLFHGHVLLVPKQHHEAIWDLPPELHAGLLGRTQAISKAVRETMSAKGVFNAMNNVVSQSVPHLHMHVVPRNPKDGLRGFFWPRTKYASDDEAAAVADLIRGRLVGESR